MNNAQSSPAPAMGTLEWAPRLKHLLVAIDFPTNGSRANTAFIRSIALFLKARPLSALTLVHVVPYERIAVSDYAGLKDPGHGPIRDAAKVALEELRTELPREANVDLVVREGAVAQEICEVSKEKRCDCLLLASHGRRGLSRAFIGSVAEEVLRIAPCSVLVLKLRPESPSMTLKFDYLAVAYDGSNSSRAALAVGLEFARHGAKNLVLIRAVDAVMVNVPDPLVTDDFRVQTAREELETQAISLPCPLRIGCVTHLGTPWKVIGEAARSLRCDLVFIGTKERRRFGESLWGTTVERIVRCVPCAVMVVRPVVKS